MNDLCTLYQHTLSATQPFNDNALQEHVKVEGPNITKFGMRLVTQEAWVVQSIPFISCEWLM